VRDQVSHHYETTGKILYILVLFKISEMRQEGRRLWTDWQEAFPEFNLLLISSWMKFWLVTFIPKELNLATFSYYLLAISELWFCPTFWWRGASIFLVLCVFASGPTSLPAINRASVLCFISFMFKVTWFKNKNYPLSVAWYLVLSSSLKDRRRIHFFFLLTSAYIISPHLIRRYLTSAVDTASLNNAKWFPGDTHTQELGSCGIWIWMAVKEFHKYWRLQLLLKMVKVKLSLCLTKHHAIKACWGVEV
jgi:hypothetical protein